MSQHKTYSRHLVCLFTLAVIMLSGCAGSHFATMSNVQQAVQAEDYQRAEALIADNKPLKNPRNQVLYLLEKGTVAHLGKRYAESNQLFAQADELMEELQIASVSGTLSEWVLSSTTSPYSGEDFERVMAHYYMALNYLALEDFEGALVECRRVNTLLQEFNDRYEQKNVYKTDAFMLYLSGLIYDAMGETNDAFIDYRNAYNTYISDYQQNYGTSAPRQLPEHLLRTASALGFSEEVEMYSRSTHRDTWTTQQEYRNVARLVVIWDNGSIPYKRQRIYREYIEHDEEKGKGCYVKFAFPEFVWRPPLYTRATVSVGGYTSSLEFAEDLSRIAIKNLEDRRLRNVVKAITRNMLKCLAEHEVKEENELLGWLIALLTELSEQADTRSWLLLPANIHITQILLPPGVSDVEIVFSDASGQIIAQQWYEAMTFKKGRTSFLLCRTF